MIKSRVSGSGERPRVAGAALLTTYLFIVVVAAVALLHVLNTFFIKTATVRLRAISVTL